MNPTLELTRRGNAILHNGSSRAIWVFTDLDLQPVVLDLTDAAGHKLEATDSRADKKFDNTPTREAFQNVAAGASLDLSALQVSGGGSSYEVSFGPYVFGAVAPGTYTAVARWQSHQSRYFDESTHRLRQLEGVWLGELASAPVALTIPIR